MSAETAKRRMGRPRRLGPVMTVKVDVAPEDHAFFLQMGGSQWMRDLLARERAIVEADSIGVQTRRGDDDDRAA